MSEGKYWQIPDDWDGVEWECITLHWPASEKWRRLLIGLLYTLTRGREWDRSSGTITAAQAVGWEIFEFNVPLISCEGNEVAGLPAEIRVGGSGLIVLEGDEMGQVVTKVYIDPESGELVVEYGPCCVSRFAVGGEAVITPGGEVETPDEPTQPDYPPDIDPPPIEVEFDACAKALILIERLEAMGRAAWDSRATPWDMAGAIKDANPGYSLSMTNVTSLWVAAASLTLIEGITDTDIFNAEFLHAWKCWLKNRLGDDADGLSATQWLAFGMYPAGYVFSEGTPDFDMFFDIYVAGYWLAVTNVLGRERAKQIMQESIGQVEDCDDCVTGLPPDPDEEGLPTAAGYYLGANMAAGQYNSDHGGGWWSAGVRGLTAMPVYGVLMSMEPVDPSGNSKRMDWDPVKMGHEVDESAFSDTSDNMTGEGFKIGTPLVVFQDETEAGLIAATKGHSAIVWRDAEPFDVLGVPGFGVDVLLGARIVIADDPIILASARWIHNTADL